MTITYREVEKDGETRFVFCKDGVYFGLGQDQIREMVKLFMEIWIEHSNEGYINFEKMVTNAPELLFQGLDEGTIERDILRDDILQIREYCHDIWIAMGGKIPKQITFG